MLRSLAAALCTLERFAPKPQAEPTRAEAFEIVLQRSELTLTVPPDRSILS